jgi:hypothetical protein
MKNISLIIFFAASLFLNTLFCQTTPDYLLLKNYRPKSIYNIPITKIEKAKFPVIDMHSHPYVSGNEIDL